MQNQQLIRKIDQLNGNLMPSEASSRPAENRVLMCRPDHFRVAYGINPHMLDAAGQLHQIDQALALAQWQALHDSYQSLGIEVSLIEPAAGLCDMVFCANQSFPFWAPDKQSRQVFLSRMAAAERQAEVAHFKAWYQRQGFEIREWPEGIPQVEGMGDLIWVPQKRYLCAGFGFRTDELLLSHLPSLLECPVVGLELIDPRFYHLDTCLAFLDDKTALWYPKAFSEASQMLLEALIPRLTAVAEQEATMAFACNAHCPDGKTVLIDAACQATIKQLRAMGFAVIPLETTEFRKSGGSVFCLKMMLP